MLAILFVDAFPSLSLSIGQFNENSALYYSYEVTFPSLRSPVDQSIWRPITMSVTCPNCGSHQIITRDLGRKMGGTTGAVAGSTLGVTGALNGGRTGGAIGFGFMGPVGAGLGSLAGAILGGLAGGAAGSMTGAKLGEQIDHNVLDNHQCQACGQTFRAPQETVVLSED
ncbi:hypothetical protein [Halochromatium salexigens]|nr:hypothetical protein [Halochromatium salexigens]